MWAFCVWRRVVERIETTIFAAVEATGDVRRIAQLILQLNAKLFIRAVRDISDTQGEEIIHPAINPPHWIIGHTLSNRYYLLQCCDASVQDPYAEYYGDGKGLTQGVRYPPVSEILQAFRSFSPVVEAAMLNFPLENLQQPAPFPLPVQDQTGRGLLAFLLQHESYHVGQLSIIHQMLGHGPIGYT